MGVFKRGYRPIIRRSLYYNSLPLPLNKGKGIKGIGLLEIKGVRSINTLI